MFLVVFAVTLAVGGAVALIGLLASREDAPAKPTAAQTIPVGSADGHTLSQGGSEAPEPRRLPLVGQEGYSVVINRDGSSDLVGPDGAVVRRLAEPGPAPVDESKLPALPEPPPPRRGLGQIIVCDKGVVDVPRDAVITFVGEDRVVTHAPNGTSVVYHVDGRIEYRDRPERRSPATSTKPN